MSHNRIKIVLLVLIVILASYLRFSHVLKTEVEHDGIRNDAAEYINYAMNIHHNQIYSKENPFSITIPADSHRPPGYPWYLSLFVSDFSLKAIINIELSQALLGVISIFLLYLIARFLLPSYIALLPPLLMAISPQLIMLPTFIVSESLFIFTSLLGVVACIYYINKNNNNKNMLWLIIIIGLLFSYSVLIRSIYIFAIAIPFVIFIKYREIFTKQHALLGIIIFALPLILWAIRNYLEIGKFSDSTVMIATMVHGSYPGIMYENNLSSYGFPDRFDPHYESSVSSLATACQFILSKISSDPLAYLKWYLVEKHLYLLAWHDAQSFQQFFIYPVKLSPFFNNWLFQNLFYLMHKIHYINIFALLCSPLMYFYIKHKLKAEEAISFLLIILLIFYYIASNIIFNPLARYFYPALPLVFICSCWFYYQLYGNLPAISQSIKNFANYAK